jgi:hypothetical protein
VKVGEGSLRSLLLSTSPSLQFLGKEFTLKRKSNTGEWQFPVNEVTVTFASLDKKRYLELESLIETFVQQLQSQNFNLEVVSLETAAKKTEKGTLRKKITSLVSF